MKTFVALCVFLAIGMLAGCNTMEGMGKDIERGGEKLQNSAKDTKEKMYSSTEALMERPHGRLPSITKGA
jgi:predicted small secreted protein